MVLDNRDELIRLAEQTKRMDQAFKRIGKFDTWICTVDVSGFLEGEFADWPAHIQDPIYRAVEKQCKPKPGEHVKIVVARCYKDVPDEPAYLRIVAQAHPLLEH